MLDLTEILACPLCGSSVYRDGGALRCESGHSYDVAKEGYVNLLPPGRSGNACTGDDKEMVRARRAFLETGSYDKISDGMTAAVLKYSEHDDKLVIADAGCGEGYHTCRIADGLRKNGVEVLCAAFDASKRAAAAGEKLAGRFSPTLAPRGGVGVPLAEDCGGALVGFTTGNIFHMPLKNSSCDAVLSMFAPIPWSECERVLKHEGTLVVAASGEDHLIEMRRVIYEKVNLKTPSPSPSDGFDLIGRERLKYSFSLQNTDDIMNLFGMTPFSYRASPDAKKRLSTLSGINLTADVEYFIYRKRG